MRLTRLEQIRLNRLIRLRRHPPTRGHFILRSAVGCAVYCTIGLALAVALGRKQPALAYFCAGAICYSAVCVLVLVLGIVTRWRLTDAIINWDRVEELHAAEKKKGV